MNRNKLGIVLVVAVLTIAGVVFAFHNHGSEDFSDSRFPNFPRPITDEDHDWMTYQEAQAFLDKAFEGYTSTVSVDITLDEVKDAQQQLDAALKEVDEDYMFFTWDFNRDPASLNDQYEGWSFLANSMKTVTDDLIRDAVSGPNKDDFIQFLGKDYVESLMNEEPTSEALLELMKKESGLLADYSVCSKSDVDSLTRIYLELVDVRNGIAKEKGYDTYVEYAYKVNYLRDYTPQDSIELARMLKESGLGSMYRTFLDSGEKPGIDFSYTDPEELFDAVEPFISSISPVYEDLYDYLREYDLIDFDNLDTKAPGGYCMSNASVVYIYYKPSMDYNDLQGLVHEFGHSANFVLPRVPTGTPDQAEVHSFGMEMLFAANPGGVVGDSRTYAYSAVYDMLDVMFQCVVYDEFQQMAYSGDYDSAEDLTQIYNDIWASYGLEPQETWYSRHHVFDFPLYMISYCVSSLSALDLFFDAIVDYDATVQKYLDIVAYDKNGFKTMVVNLGIMNPFNKDDLVGIKESVEAWLSEYYGSE